uniref:Uncharacterized protein n=1 Tax=Ananas comosus var. bracteatus TaxID=296719 RepID=A0A6V7PY71_ANACO|nr:unnamed protein product [Ananas comosus var. bracteatus]
MESVQLEHENVTELVLVTLRDGVEEGRRFSNEEKDPITSKELNEELYYEFPGKAKEDVTLRDAYNRIFYSLAPDEIAIAGDSFPSKAARQMASKAEDGWSTSCSMRVIRSGGPFCSGKRTIPIPNYAPAYKVQRAQTSHGAWIRFPDRRSMDHRRSLSPWPFASESVLPSQCPGIHPMHDFR